MLHQINTAGGICIEYYENKLAYTTGISNLIDKLDTHRGALFTSGVEYPGRYTCWDIGFYNPPLAIIFRQKEIVLQALNKRGEVLLLIFLPALAACADLAIKQNTKAHLIIQVRKSLGIFGEEERSKQPSVFSILRLLIAVLHGQEDYLGFYGAFGYDLVFEFEDLQPQQARDKQQRDLVLYLPDEIYVVNHQKEEAFVRRYDFAYQGLTTQSLPREGKYQPYITQVMHQEKRECSEIEYTDLVQIAKEHFARGDLFEVVLSQSFYSSCSEQPSAVFKRMCAANPAPYGFFINLGEGEYLLGASPEMYVRVQGKRVESCPISGTIARGANPIEDAQNIQSLLESPKEAAELTMCTDVDRNDKSRICKAGSVQVIGRRQIEMYSRLIHTVDHVEGILRDGFDAIDAFLTHMWVVTVTGAPKLWAMKFIEKYEKSPRKWYAGAVGWFGCNGNLNTGLVLRTFQIAQGVATMRTGATLLYDSQPKAEEEETRLKAAAFLEILHPTSKKKEPKDFKILSGKDKKVLLIDHEDSFVHTLANYLRQTGAEVFTTRFEHALDYIENKHHFNLVVLSPGPGRPQDFNLSQTIAACIKAEISIFGVCLGLQGIVEYFGGALDTLDYPMHGKPTEIFVKAKSGLFAGLGSSFIAGRYHSLYATIENMPAELKVIAVTGDNIVMAVEHRNLPISAVQFHPETILSLKNQSGLKIIFNLMQMIKS